MAQPTLPKLELPANTWILYENVAIDAPDRTGNWRFLIRDDGYFFHARNTQYWLEDLTLINSADPDLHWNTAFGDNPNRCLNDSQLNDLRDALDKAQVSKLEPYYAPSPDEQESHPSAERWTITHDELTHTIVVERGAVPKALVTLRQKIDELIADAPRIERS